jgi:hypothetical protein
MPFGEHQQAESIVVPRGSFGIAGNIDGGRIFFTPADVEDDMKRLSLSLACLLISTLAYAQTNSVPPATPSPPASGTEGDSWLFLLVIPFIVVAAAVYFYIKRNRPTSRF